MQLLFSINLIYCSRTIWRTRRSFREPLEQTEAIRIT